MEIIMDLEKIRELIKIVEESSFDEFSYTEDMLSIVLKKNTAVPAGPAIELRNSSVETDKDREEEDDGTEYILSPMVGTFYCASSPDAPSFANVGDRLHVGDTLCIIEAMKLMNEIECPYDAEILSVVVSNEQKVEYGQPLFKIKKL